MVIDAHGSLSLSIQDERTPLMTASFNGHVDVVRVLIEAQADVHSQDEVWYICLRHLNTSHERPARDCILCKAH